MFEGYLVESAVRGGFGATTELGRKAIEWMKQASSNNDVPSLMIMPDQNLLSELRAAAVKKIVINSRKYVASSPQFSLFTIMHKKYYNYVLITFVSKRKIYAKAACRLLI